ncbi:DUF4232 domain-containing protein [Streptomyces rapamycinicus]|uniref:DUF4232 domain-containing protein n=2 Tax=Streptomyces rapamycinicus TaxID=1226757 RepID=A0A0A0NBL1_STRRN|nr:DUF4232 domain-containing protein [Streptomyces rapamycinicus]AGP56842.1 hypothetical protein M271_26860 [Streptomyces rapamycinicus NRRL 5491]MBB4784462.1 hypothetical protein [Streptomyces rapamycinicus]RLV80055.1 hypothetical protein D3C57_116760 [Streptomyces rapamycinicus NRRL 5491]UTO64770.1 DUF4232 domain-containing protein [Streptomyces rapamycinicus]UTP32727.1 DUF4232 domain-containing protein [Streptomyces rapamycinicus NRRL 5491]
MSHHILNRRIRKAGAAVLIAAASAVALTACGSNDSSSDAKGSSSSKSSQSDASIQSQAGNKTDKQAATLGSGADKAQATSECQPGTLRGALDSAGTSQAEMNHRGTFLKVTNTGDETCVISGYAGLALEGAGHTAIKTTARHGSTYFATDPGTHPITLAPGKSAWADLVWTTTGAGTAHAKYLQISPTGSNSHSTVAFNQDLDNGTLSLTAWSTKPPINN